MHGAAPCPGSQAAIADFCGCRERCSAPGRFIQMGRSGDGAFPGAAELQLSSFSFFFSCLMMADWQPAETPLRGCRRKPNRAGQAQTPGGPA